MTSRSASLVGALLFVTVMAASVATRQLPPGYVDPAPVLDAAAKAIGTGNPRCVTIAGTACAGAVGQQRESARNVDWPRVDALANYTRTMDWEHATMKEEFDRKPGLPPASWKYGVRWIDGPLQRERHQVFTVKDFIRENFIISDGTRNLNVHYVNPLQHAEGMLMADLPRERRLFEADPLDTDQPRPTTPTSDQLSFLNAVRKLGLDPSQVVPVHGRPERWTDVRR